MILGGMDLGVRQISRVFSAGGARLLDGLPANLFAPPVPSGLTQIGWLDPRGDNYQDSGQAALAGIGDPIGYAADFAGGSFGSSQSSSSKRPVVVVDSNGALRWRFDGSDDDLLSASLSTINQPYTVCVGLILQGNPAVTSRIIRLGANATINISNGGVASMNAGTSLSLGALTIGTPYVLACTFNGASSLALKNGAQISGNAGTNATGGGAFSIASNQAGTSEFVQEDLAPILIYTGAADFTGLAQLDAWYQALRYR